MFTWNRVEVLVTLSLGYCQQVRAVLQQHQIKHQCRQVRLEKQGFHFKSDGMLRRNATEYHLYVHQDSYELAKTLIQAVQSEDNQTVVAPEELIRKTEIDAVPEKLTRKTKTDAVPEKLTQKTKTDAVPEKLTRKRKTATAPEKQIHKTKLDSAPEDLIQKTGAVVATEAV